MINIKCHTKVRCPCGKYFWTPNHLLKRGFGKYCSLSHSKKYRNYKKREEKYGFCINCSRKYLNKLGCIFCKRNLEKR
jgi:hypothetical protein